MSRHNDTNSVLGADTKIPAKTLKKSISKGYVLINPKPNCDNP